MKEERYMRQVERKTEGKKFDKYYQRKCLKLMEKRENKGAILYRTWARMHKPTPGTEPLKIFVDGLPIEYNHQPCNHMSTQYHDDGSRNWTMCEDFLGHPGEHLKHCVFKSGISFTGSL